MKKTQYALGAAALALIFSGPVAYAQTSQGNASSGSSAQQSGGKSGAKSTLSKAEQNVMRDLAHANLSEIATAELALKQSQSEEVKSFAQKMIEDHGTAQKELEQLAQSKGVTLPTEPDTKHKAAMKAMSVLEGEKFDKMYMAQGGTRDHKNTHDKLTKAQKNVKDPELKAHVDKVTPIVAQHLKLAQDHQGKKETSSGSSDAKGSSASGSGQGAMSSGSSGAGSSPGSSMSGTRSTTTSPGGSAPSGSSGVSGTSGSSNSGGGSR